MKENWTEVISPKRSLLEINIKELWRYRDLIMLFVRRDFVSVYKQTILGPLWLFIQPLFTTLTFFFVFNQIAKIPTNDIDPILFYLSGITLWNYFSDCFSKTSNTFVANAGIFGKVYFPRLATPISIVISNLIKLGIQVLLFLAIMLYQMVFNKVQVHVNMYILILPYLIFLMAIMGLGLGIIFSALTTKYRDLSFLLTFGIQLLMYATPVIYPSSFIPEQYRKYAMLNPLSSIVEGFRHVFLHTDTMPWRGLGYSTIFAFVFLSFGVIIFSRIERTFMDTI
jgi:lipopolysaccharide transport system permease protein